MSFETKFIISGMYYDCIRDCARVSLLRVYVRCLADARRDQLISEIISNDGIMECYEKYFYGHFLIFLIIYYRDFLRTYRQCSTHVDLTLDW